MTPCPVCGGASTSSAAPYRHTHPMLSGMVRASCGLCEMVFAAPMPDEGAWADYNSSYFDNAHGGVATHPVATAFHSGINRIRVAHIEEYLSERQLAVSSILEVGPGGAEFAQHWLARHPTTVYRVIESDTDCHPGLVALGIRVVNGPDDLKNEPPVDLVVLSHVLEHVTDPVGFLGAMTARLRPGGVLFIEVPCRDWAHKTLDEPHLLFFDREPMARLLDRVGFDEVQLSYHGQRIEALRRKGLLRRTWDAVRFRLLSRGIVRPFASIEPGLEVVRSPIERAAVRPFQPHIAQQSPAWWLRAVAIKR